jgi:hypothetical protein
MSRKWAEGKPEKPDFAFEVEGENKTKIPVEVYFAVPFEVARQVEIVQHVEGEDYPNRYYLHIDKATYTHEYVVSDMACIPLFVTQDKEHFLHLLRERVLPHYDGDLVKKIEVIVR